jgi:hypothetical protein
MRGLDVTGCGGFANRGDARAVIYNLRNSTTDATPTELFIAPNNVSNTRIDVIAQTVIQFEVKVAAYDSTNNKAAAWTIRGAIRRNNSNTTALIGTPTSEGWADTGLESAAVAVTADTVNHALRVTVTGIAAATIRWHAAVVTSEVSFGAPA